MDEQTMVSLTPAKSHPQISQITQIEKMKLRNLCNLWIIPL